LNPTSNKPNPGQTRKEKEIVIKDYFRIWAVVILLVALAVVGSLTVLVAESSMPTAAEMPKERIQHFDLPVIGEFKEGQEGWIIADSLVVDKTGRTYVLVGTQAYPQYSDIYEVRIKKVKGGFAATAYVGQDWKTWQHSWSLSRSRIYAPIVKPVVFLDPKDIKP
jgi:hypothetical protein